MTVRMKDFDIVGELWLKMKDRLVVVVIVVVIGIVSV